MDNQHCASQNRFWALLSKKLANEAAEVELQELHSILLSNPDLHHQADLISEMWEQKAKNSLHSNEAAYMRHIMKHKDDFFTEQSNEPIVPLIPNEKAENERPSESRFRFSRRLTIVSFVALIILTAGAVYFFPGKKNVIASAKQEISSVVTKNGNRTKIVLPDGSQVWLNAGSNLDYNNSTFNKELREVTLNGEAYFDVTKNEAKPFIIHTKKMDIKVVGTAFNVRSYNDEKIAEASLIRGSIEVTLKDRDQKLVLKPNEKISINTEEAKQITSKAGEKISVKSQSVIPQLVVNELKPNPTNNIIPEIAWTQNKLYFEDKSLEDIVPMLEKWFGKTVILQTESLKKVRYTGNFENETIENVLSYLKLSRPFNFKMENDSVVIY